LPAILHKNCYKDHWVKKFGFMEAREVGIVVNHRFAIEFVLTTILHMSSQLFKSSSPMVSFLYIKSCINLLKTGEKVDTNGKKKLCEAIQREIIFCSQFFILNMLFICKKQFCCLVFLLLQTKKKLSVMYVMI